MDAAARGDAGAIGVLERMDKLEREHARKNGWGVNKGRANGLPKPSVVVEKEVSEDEAMGSIDGEDGE